MPPQSLLLKRRRKINSFVMGFFLIWEWRLFLVLNVFGVALSYFVIPARIWLARRSENRAIISDYNSGLFIAFILACGIGHIVMPTVMWAGMSWMESNLDAVICAELRKSRPPLISASVYVLLLVSAATTVVSWEAALRLRVKV